MRDETLMTGPVPGDSIPFWRSLKVRERLSSPRVDKINATIAIRPEYEVQFTLRPRDERVRKNKGRQ